MLRAALWRIPASDPGCPVIVIIDMESESELVRPWRAIGRSLVELADVKVVVVPRAEVTAARVAAAGARGLILSGYLRGAPDRHEEALGALLTATELPVLGICGGHQYLGEAFGATVVAAAEEYGAVAVELMPAGTADPLFAGIESPMTVFGWHRLRLEAPPPGFVRLAGNDAALVQAVRHAERPVYGVQFHPELEVRPREGRRLLGNFLSIAGVELRSVPPR